MTALETLIGDHATGAARYARDALCWFLPPGAADHIEARLQAIIHAAISHALDEAAKLPQPKAVAPVPEDLFRRAY